MRPLPYILLCLQLMSYLRNLRRMPRSFLISNLLRCSDTIDEYIQLPVQYFSVCTYLMLPYEKQKAFLCVVILEVIGKKYNRTFRGLIKLVRETHDMKVQHPVSRSTEIRALFFKSTCTPTTICIGSNPLFYLVLC